MFLKKITYKGKTINELLDSSSHVNNPRNNLKMFKKDVNLSFFFFKHY